MENTFLDLPNIFVDNLKLTDSEMNQVAKQIESLQRVITGLNLYKQAVVTDYIQKNNIENAISLTEDYRLEIKQPQESVSE